MKYLLLVSHGDFSNGLKQTLSMFAGETINSVIAVGLKPDETSTTLEHHFETILEKLPTDAQFIVLADIIGGSPLTTVCNTLNKYNKLQDSFIIGGMNFSMALTALMSKDTMDEEELKAKIMSESKGAIKFLDIAVASETSDDDI
ncbi:MAG: PTS fructose transporter subunit IIA [Liquorilactobacillus hordei]|uniref:Phosphotransferase system, mannose fructose-specific component IIA n=1 Tax=Liquorilactobacillus hordei DSM 19519 TaxID=1423759 RepID=A0A0R1ML83_9LACO|nr:PTS fructose transporter subunit IIA [Liquorilactobacillus hordei]KRL05307.1 phosphotransferase system, mannose fructose-specific component IIA [Liquorilactobacillus hordei DSM 19519]QYH51224.1 PTS fructose transporter subunit IIA [Liquorilactobacillus hordei DSM 19519]QYH53054.1 PTS fructose transporter subunit IIA [Liquorilactobacillus hordei DSM 19519]